jgi:hypothetical protein
MVETFTPAVCGSRARHRLAVALFALGALLASAGLGAALGALGGLVGTGPALVAAAVVALLAALRETGVPRIPLPQARRQVPERWRRDWPLPAWSAAYGAGLGAGFLTFQPVATFWVACGAALALGRPLLGACCFALYGAGRALMAVWPGRGEPDGAVAVERLVARTTLVSRVNAAVLVLAVVLLAVAPAAGAGVTALGRGFDPSADGGALARATVGSGGVKVIVDPPAPDPSLALPSADSPSLDGDLLAYADADGITVIDWRANDRHVVARIGGGASDPALDWPLLAFRREGASHERLLLVDLRDPSSVRRIASVRAADDLGRPSLRGGRLAWHRITPSGSQVFVLDLATGRRRTIEQTRRWMEWNPSVTKTRVVWVEQRVQGSSLRLRWLSHRRARTILRVKGRRTFLWTTALSGRAAYATKLTPATGRTELLRVGF